MECITAGSVFIGVIDISALLRPAGITRNVLEIVAAIFAGLGFLKLFGVA